MDNIIIIGFNNDTKTYELPKEIIKFYPNSILSLYGAAETNEKIIIEDMTYEQFQTVYDVIIGKQKQWLVPQNIVKFMDKYGFVDDILLKLQNNINAQLNREMLWMDDFVNGKENQLLLTNTSEQYDEYKKLFGNNKNIMSVQITYDLGKLICINILEKVPIYYKENTFDNIKFENNMDINLMRHNVIVKNLGCSDCNICCECDPLETIYLSCKNCHFCVRCKIIHESSYYKTKQTIRNRLIYDNNKATYFNALCVLIHDDDGFPTFQKLKSNDINMINWFNVSSEKFNDNIGNSLNTIIDVIVDNDLWIKKYYKGFSDKLYCNDANVLNREDIEHFVVTYFGFLNISNILK